MNRGPCALLLAAGLGTRYREVAGPGADKLLARCRGRDGSERAVLEHAVRALAPHLERVLLVTRPDNAGAIALGQALGCEVLTLASPGMGDSIAAAVRHTADSAGWLIALGDMPFVLPATIARVLQALHDDAIVVPTCNDLYGHPVAFGRHHGLALAGLSGERGARRVLQSHPLQELAVDDGGVLWDVDTPQQLTFAG
jgi:molybdenum cofactor cytidylyltransferase